MRGAFKVFGLQPLGGFPQTHLKLFPQLLQLQSLFMQAFDFCVMRLYLLPQILEKRPHLLDLEFTARRNAPRPGPPLKFVGKREHRSLIA